MRNVICMKWGQKYGPEYVNVLNRMVCRHLSGAFRFICFTDSTEGLDAHIETLPLPQCNLPNRPETEAWRKLSLFQADIGVWGDTLFLDLDLVITSSLDAFFELPGTFCIIHNWTHPERRVGNSSIFRFVPGSHKDVFEQFVADPEGVAMQYRNEQVFLSACIDRVVGLTFWPKDWCKSFKKHCLPRGLAKFFRAPRMPTECRVVVFHGNPNPPDAAQRWWYRSQKSFRIPKFMRPARWILAHWR